MLFVFQFLVLIEKELVQFLELAEQYLDLVELLQIQTDWILIVEHFQIVERLQFLELVALFPGLVEQIVDLVEPVVQIEILEIQQILIVEQIVEQFQFPVQCDEW